jgi:hypothetical protein
MHFMRTTVDVPDPIFRKIKATAALRGVSLKEFLLSAVEREMAMRPLARDYTVRVPLIPSKRPGKRTLTNAEIEDLLA